MNNDVPRILFVSHDASATGAPNSLLDFLRCIRAQGTFDFRVLLLKGGPLEGAFAELGFTHVVRRERPIAPPPPPTRWRRLLDRVLPHPPPLPPGLQWVCSSVEQEEVNRFLTGFPADLFYLNSVAAAPILGYLGKRTTPVITYVRELHEHVQKTIETGWFEELVERTSLFISVSMASIHHLVQNHDISPSRFALINTFVDVEKLNRQSRAVSREQLRELVGKKEVGPFVLGCGTTDWRKGPDLFIQAAKSFFTRNPESRARFVWIGGMAEKSEREKITFAIGQAGLTERVLFVGAQKNSAQLIAGADVLALTSREDPFPRVILEAGIADVPTVCFKDTGGAEEFVAKGTGIAVNAFDTVDFAEAVHRLLDDDALRSELGKSAHETVLNEHNSQISSQRIIAQIEEQVFAVKPLEAVS